MLEALISKDDQIKSIKRLLFRLYDAGSKVGIEINRVQEIKRPSWYIKQGSSQNRNQTLAFYEERTLWQILYFGTSRADVQETLVLLQNVIEGGDDKKLRRLIPAWRFSWQFPQVYPVVLTDSAGTLNGTYQIQVSGVDLAGNESAASTAQAVIVGAPSNAIRIMIPRIPYSYPLFKAYNVYINGKLEATVPQHVIAAAGANVYVEHTVKSLSGTGVSPKAVSESLAIRWKYMRVEDFSFNIREDDIVNGTHTGLVNLTTCVTQERSVAQTVPMRTVGIKVGGQ